MYSPFSIIIIKPVYDPLYKQENSMVNNNTHKPVKTHTLQAKRAHAHPIAEAHRQEPLSEIISFLSGIGNSGFAT